MGRTNDLPSGTFRFWDLVRGIFTVIPDKMVQKLRIIILLHLRLITFNFHFPQNHKIIIFVIFGPGGGVHGPQNHLYLPLGPLNYFNQFKKSPESFSKICFGKSQNRGTPHFKKFGKDGPGNPEDPFLES